jgi:hypothetical protein
MRCVLLSKHYFRIKCKVWTSSSCLSHFSALDGSTSKPLYPQVAAPATYGIGGSAGPKADLHAVEKG